MSDQNRLKKIIKIKKKSNFLNHLMSFLFYGSSSWFGEIDQQKIKLWQPRFTGIFYTVFSLEFDSKGKLIKIKDNLNPAGKIIFILSFLLLFYGILPKNISDTTNKIFWFILLIFVLLGCLILAVAVLVYRFEKNKQLKKIMRVIRGIKKIKAFLYNIYTKI